MKMRLCENASMWKWELRENAFSAKIGCCENAFIEKMGSCENKKWKLNNIFNYILQNFKNFSKFWEDESKNISKNVRVV